MSSRAWASQPWEQQNRKFEENTHKWRTRKDRNEIQKFKNTQEPNNCKSRAALSAECLLTTFINVRAVQPVSHKSRKARAVAISIDVRTVCVFTAATIVKLQTGRILAVVSRQAATSEWTVWVVANMATARWVCQKSKEWIKKLQNWSSFLSPSVVSALTSICCPCCNTLKSCKPTGSIVKFYTRWLPSMKLSAWNKYWNFTAPWWQLWSIWHSRPNFVECTSRHPETKAPNSFRTQPHNHQLPPSVTGVNVQGLSGEHL